MVTLARSVLAYLRALFLPRHNLALEAVALRQQLAVLKRKQPRPKLDRSIGCSGLCSASSGMAGLEP